MCRSNLKSVALPVPEIIATYLKKFVQSLDMLQMFDRLLFGRTLGIVGPNLKFVALPVPEIIEGTQKLWAIPGYADALFCAKCLMGFCSDGP